MNDHDHHHHHPAEDVRERKENVAGHEVTRREFLRKSIFGATAAWTLPTFLGNTLFELDARAASNAPQAANGGPILIIMQMGGGNDSLNTVIPYSNSVYISERPTLRINPVDHGAFTIGNAPALSGGSQYNEAMALHPRLTKLRQLWLDGNLAIVNGVGYPNPNLSHFTSFDYYHTAKPNEFVTDGWLGRFFDHQCSGCEPQSAVHLDDQPTLAMRSVNGTIASVAASDPRYLSWQYFDKRERKLENLFRRGIGVDDPVDRGIASGDEALAYVQRSAHAALISSRAVQASLAATGSGFPHVTFPSTTLGNRFKDIAALIQGGSATNIYYVEQGGYDTHGRQIDNNGSNPTTGVHANLLGDLDGALGAFAAEMKAQGNWNRVLLFTFSEFGRKVPQNGSWGTDHGAAETLFAMGGAVKPGFYGLLPDLAQQARIKNNSLVHNVDFRRVYRTALQNWLGVPAATMNAIFPSQPADFSPLGFV